MALLLMVLGFAIGQALFPVAIRFDSGGQPQAFGYAGGLFGVAVAFCIWFVMTVVAYFGGGRILMASSRAHRIQKEDHPQLFNVVEEMTIASGLPKMPDVYIIDDMALNAFATGRDPDHAAVAVTAGLLSRLNRDQLQGVIAHEIGHVVNRDILFMQMLAIMLGAIVMIAQGFLRGMFYSGGARRAGRSRSSSKGGGQAQAIMLIVAIVLAILAPLFAQLIYLAASRRREYLADAQAAVLTRYPEGLASALQVISGDTLELASANKATAPMYISNPLQKKKLKSAGLFSTHPPMEERVKILRGMVGNASFVEYQRATQTLGGAASIPASALAETKAVPIREARPDARKKLDPKQQLRQVGDALRNANRFVFLPCVCGLRIKLPPDFKHDKVACPKCHRALAVPVAGLAGAAALGEAVTGGIAPDTGPAKAKRGKEPLKVTRRGKGWQSFKCTCGKTMTLSAAFAGQQVTCRNCKRQIIVDHA